MGTPLDFTCAAEMNSALRQGFSFGKTLERRTCGVLGQGPRLFQLLPLRYGHLVTAVIVGVLSVALDSPRGQPRGDPP